MIFAFDLNKNPQYEWGGNYYTLLQNNTERSGIITESALRLKVINTITLILFVEMSKSNNDK